MMRMPIADRYLYVPAGRARSRHGIALLLTLFVLAITGALVVNLFDAETLQRSALRNTIDYERAMYLANGGIHRACAELESNNSWRGTVTSSNYPGDGSYSATAVDVGGQISITAVGIAGNVQRRVQATIQF